MARAKTTADGRPSESESATVSETAATADAQDDPTEMDEDQALLMQALAMSRDGDAVTAEEAEESQVLSDMTEEEQIALAMQMSMAPGDTENSLNDANTDADGDEEMTDAMQNPEFLSSVLGSLPGVDPSDEALMSAMGIDKADKEGKDNDAEEKK
ncbi:hypothetical protein SARC_08492 [Sphaeroforma arctica JP610]|uniref:26S proteasome non-ATPase regulatory subunit 4 n=1 Tax=Sphaeroforma arctica JP610 TaxID=667725 RepID=A0A0L0FQP9_9EUKA|nr:hypothetical protein SARC_08492 [Sphaeroforma arctica JP610]KNC79107.1 hypothetical protein SARC_08492 [Sphaeroforma arctica JP610]|eukprot:XP_014153009.1 hypothetical protein SARC_08492 [Sphaeroforma arctica JP610]